MSTGPEISLLKPLGSSLTAAVEIWGESKAFMGDVLSGPGCSHHCPASCHLKPARSWCNTRASAEINFNFCFAVRLNYQTVISSRSDAGVCASEVNVQSGFEGHGDSGCHL